MGADGPPTQNRSNSVCSKSGAFHVSIPMFHNVKFTLTNPLVSFTHGVARESFAKSYSNPAKPKLSTEFCRHCQLNSHRACGTRSIQGAGGQPANGATDVCRLTHDSPSARPLALLQPAAPPSTGPRRARKWSSAFLVAAALPTKFL